MADDDIRLDRVVGDQPRDGRMDRGVGVTEVPVTPLLVEGDAPAVTVGAGAAAAVEKAGKAEADVRRHVGAHAQELTHGVPPGERPAAGGGEPGAAAPAPAAAGPAPRPLPAGGARRPGPCRAPRARAAPRATASQPGTAGR